jgi:hypothetical protein
LPSCPRGFVADNGGSLLTSRSCQVTAEARQHAERMAWSSGVEGAKPVGKLLKPRDNQPTVV